jgi:hypothetical protein
VPTKSRRGACCCFLNNSSKYENTLSLNCSCPPHVAGGARRGTQRPGSGGGRLEGRAPGEEKANSTLQGEGRGQYALMCLPDSRRAPQRASFVVCCRNRRLRWRSVCGLFGLVLFCVVEVGIGSESAATLTHDEAIERLRQPKASVPMEEPWFVAVARPEVGWLLQVLTCTCLCCPCPSHPSAPCGSC